LLPGQITGGGVAVREVEALVHDSVHRGVEPRLPRVVLTGVHQRATRLEQHTVGRRVVPGGAREWCK
jgi:hypothetical protein